MKKAKIVYCDVLSGLRKEIIIPYSEIENTKRWIKSYGHNLLELWVETSKEITKGLLKVRVYAREGETQKESFWSSYGHDFSDDIDGTRIIKVACYDKTGTHDYVDVTIIRDTLDDCYKEFYGQLTDGIFENSNVGKHEILISKNIKMKV